MIKELDEAYTDVDELIDVELNGNQTAALASFTFNLGRGAFKNSTLLNRLNNGEDPNLVVE